MKDLIDTKSLLEHIEYAKVIAKHDDSSGHYYRKQLVEPGGLLHGSIDEIKNRLLDDKHAYPITESDMTFFNYIAENLWFLDVDYKDREDAKNIIDALLCSSNSTLTEVDNNITVPIKRITDGSFYSNRIWFAPTDYGFEIIIYDDTLKEYAEIGEFDKLSLYEKFVHLFKNFEQIFVMIPPLSGFNDESILRYLREEKWDRDMEARIDFD